MFNALFTAIVYVTGVPAPHAFVSVTEMFPPVAPTDTVMEFVP